MMRLEQEMKKMFGRQVGTGGARQRGLSIVELMVGMAIGLIITAAIGVIYLNNRQTLRTQDAMARVQETGRFILETVGRSLRQAGNINMSSSEIKNYCNCVPVEGSDGDDDAPDTLTVRYETGEDESSGGNWGGRDCVGGFANAGTLVSNAFSLDGTDFQCAGSVGGTQTLASEVEDFQVTYGIDTTGDRSRNLRVEDPTDYVGTPNGTKLAPTYANGRIVTVRICVLVRSPAENVVPAGGQYTDCQGATVDNPDTRFRKAFSVTYALRNTVL